MLQEVDHFDLTILVTYAYKWPEREQASSKSVFSVKKHFETNRHYFSGWTVKDKANEVLVFTMVDNFSVTKSTNPTPSSCVPSGNINSLIFVR